MQQRLEFADCDGAVELKLERMQTSTYRYSLFYSRESTQPGATQRKNGTVIGPGDGRSVRKVCRIRVEHILGIYKRMLSTPTPDVLSVQPLLEKHALSEGNLVRSL